MVGLGTKIGFLPPNLTILGFTQEEALAMHEQENLDLWCSGEGLYLFVNRI